MALENAPLLSNTFVSFLKEICGRMNIAKIELYTIKSGDTGARGARHHLLKGGTIQLDDRDKLGKELLKPARMLKNYR